MKTSKQTPNVRADLVVDLQPDHEWNSESESTEDDFYENNSAFLLDLVEKNMLKALPDDTQRFLFLYIFILNHNYREAGEIINRPKSGVHGHIVKIRKYLAPFAKGYDFFKKWNEEKTPEDEEELNATPKFSHN